MIVHIEVVESDPFAENCFLVWAEGAETALVVDPGFDPEDVLRRLGKHSLGVAAILNTHGHVDHIAGNRAIKKSFPDAPIIIGPGDAEMLTNPVLNLSAKWGFNVTSPPADQLVAEGDCLTLAGLELDVLDIPGHSPGHVVYVVRGVQPGIVLGGDVLFAGGIGRCDFPGGNFEQLAAGIRGKLYPLPDETRVFPGHGPPTTIGEEKRTNPFVASQA